MKQLKISLIAALVSVALVGCAGQQNSNTGSSASPQTQASRPSPDQDNAAETAAARISIPEAEAAMKRGEAVFLDVRQPDAYSAGHIKGAIAMPEGEVAARAVKLPKDKKIITYCA